jgi:hypothetical protein
MARGKMAKIETSCPHWLGDLLAGFFITALSILSDARAEALLQPVKAIDLLCNKVSALAKQKGNVPLTFAEANGMIS